MNDSLHLPTVWFWAGVFASFGLYLLARLLRLWIRRSVQVKKRTEARSPDDLLIDTLQQQNLVLRQTEAMKTEKEAELLRLSEIHATLLAHIPVGVLMLDQADQIVYTNFYFKNLFEGVPATHVQQFIADTGKKTQSEYQFQGLESHALTFTYERVALPQQKSLITLVNVTRTRELERQLQLKRDLALMGEIATGITHEVKNALAVIQGHVQMLQVEPSPDHMQAIQKEIRRLLSCVKALMQSAKNDALELTQLDLVAWFDRQEQRWLQLPEGEHVQFETQARSAIIQGDPSMLTMLLDNLIRNALDALRDQSDIQIKIELRLTTTGVQLSVRDNGPGFPDDVRRKLFVPFVSTKKDGHGLGLFQCRKLVLQHGGKIWLEPQQPTCIVCEFPLKKSEETA